MCSGTMSSLSTAFEKAAVKRHGSADNDCFATLPFEIVEEIAFYLPTATVLKTRLASRTFAQLFYSQTFWASRFRANGERGFLFEAWNKTGSCDWRQLLPNKRHRRHSPLPPQQTTYLVPCWIALGEAGSHACTALDPRSCGPAPLRKAQRRSVWGSHGGKVLE
jgi:hypothetical protein